LEPLAYINKAIALCALDQHEEAMQWLDYTIMIDPRSTLAYTNKGVILSEQGQHDQALECFDKIIEMDPG
jgi:tetratricopeptide (TPR) repeat protein